MPAHCTRQYFIFSISHMCIFFYIICYNYKCITCARVRFDQFTAHKHSKLYYNLYVYRYGFRKIFSSINKLAPSRTQYIIIIIIEMLVKQNLSTQIYTHTYSRTAALIHHQRMCKLNETIQ